MDLPSIYHKYSPRSDPGVTSGWFVACVDAANTGDRYTCSVRGVRVCVTSHDQLVRIDGRVSKNRWADLGE